MSSSSTSSSSSSSTSSSSSSFSIKAKQRDALVRMLNFNSDDTEQWSDIWKVLVFDQRCSDIISPLLRVGELRQHGVTLHLSLTQDREPIPDVPALYFVAADKASIRAIAEDCGQRKYESFHLNFASHIPRHLMEDLAMQTAKTDSSQLIAKVYDQYLDFISLEDRLFTLRQHNSFQAFNDPSISDSVAQQSMESVVDSLFSALVTLGVIPIIRSPRNSSAALIAENLDRRLREHLLHSPSLSTLQSQSFQRPVLVLLDRNVDLSVMLQHTWTYQAMVHDLLSFDLNRVSVWVKDAEEDAASGSSSSSGSSSAASPQGRLQTYNLDDDADTFWIQHKASPFTEMAAAVHQQTNEYKEAKDQVSRLGLATEEAALNGGVDTSALMGKTMDLKSFASTLPQLRAKKKMLDQHVNIATALLNEIRKRELNVFVNLEERLMSKSGNLKHDVMELLRDPARGSDVDKLRLFLVAYLCNENLAPSEVEEMERALPPSVAHSPAITFLKRTRAFNANAPVRSRPSAASLATASGSSAAGLGFSFVQRGIGSITDVFSFVQSGVNALRSTSKEYFVTRIVDAIMNVGTGSSSSSSHPVDVESYLYFDPKIQKMSNGEVPRKTTPFSEAIVFILGGGCYAEHQNLQDYAASNPQGRKTIIYGSTEIVQAEQFLEQLSQLGSRSGAS